MPVKRWNFHKAKWSHYIALMNKFAKTLLLPDSLDMDVAYQDFCNTIKKAAKKTIPHRYQNNYIPCWDAECESLYKTFLQSPQADNSSLAATALLAKLESKQRDRWSEAVRSLTLLKALSILNNLTRRRCRHCLKGIHSRPDTNRTGAEGLSFYYPRLLHCLDQMLAVMLLSQHRVSSSKTVRPHAPCGARCMGHAVSTWSAVCSEVPHSQFGVNNLTGRSRHSTRHCPISADAIASQLVKNGKYEAVDCKSSQLVSQEVSDLWRTTTPDTVNISDSFSNLLLPFNI